MCLADGVVQKDGCVSSIPSTKKMRNTSNRKSCFCCSLIYVCEINENSRSCQQIFSAQAAKYLFVFFAEFVRDNDPQCVGVGEVDFGAFHLVLSFINYIFRSLTFLNPFSKPQASWLDTDEFLGIIDDKYRFEM